MANTCQTCGCPLAAGHRFCSLACELTAAHAETPLTLVVEGDAGACEDLTLGAFMADNADAPLTREQLVRLIWGRAGDTLTLGGGAAPIYWLSRREEG